MMGTRLEDGPNSSHAPSFLKSEREVVDEEDSDSVC